MSLERIAVNIGTCNAGPIETITHVLLHCPFCLGIWDIFIEPYIKLFPGCSEAYYTLLLLSGQNTGMVSKSNASILFNVAKFCVPVVKIREGKVQ